MYDTDSTLIINSLKGSQLVESAQWDFVVPNHLEPCASHSEEESGSVHEDENAGHMITSARYGLIFRSIDGL